MVTFKASKADVRKMLAIAANASLPAGMGLIHLDPSRTFTADDFKGTSADYVGGRMVKFYPREISEGVWSLGEPQYDANDMERTYQSWGRTYPTARHLIEAAGLAVIENES